MVFGVIISYGVFGWSEPSGTMPTDYKIPLNTTAESQDVAEGKPVVDNFNADEVDGYDAAELMAADSSSTGSSIYAFVANFAQNNPALSFPDCPSGFEAILQDGFTQGDGFSSVPGIYYYGGIAHYDVVGTLNGVETPLFFEVDQDTNADTTCTKNAYRYVSGGTGTSINIPVTCVGDCSDCSSAGNVTMTYSVCSRDASDGTTQSSGIIAPTISSLRVYTAGTPTNVGIYTYFENGGENCDVVFKIDGSTINDCTQSNVSSEATCVATGIALGNHTITVEVHNSSNELTPTTSSTTFNSTDEVYYSFGTDASQLINDNTEFLANDFTAYYTDSTAWQSDFFYSIYNGGDSIGWFAHNFGSIGCNTVDIDVMYGGNASAYPPSLKVYYDGAWNTAGSFSTSQGVHTFTLPDNAEGIMINNALGPNYGVGIYSIRYYNE
jgi:hypothetical protein